jgi:hypothetical protein
MRVRIQPTKINPDPDPKHYKKEKKKNMLKENLRLSLSADDAISDNISKSQSDQNTFLCC